MLFGIAIGLVLLTSLVVLLLSRRIRKSTHLSRTDAANYGIRVWNLLGSLKIHKSRNAEPEALRHISDKSEALRKSGIRTEVNWPPGFVSFEWMRKSGECQRNLTRMPRTEWSALVENCILAENISIREARKTVAPKLGVSWHTARQWAQATRREGRVINPVPEELVAEVAKLRRENHKLRGPMSC